MQNNSTVLDKLFGFYKENPDDRDSMREMYKQLIRIAWPAALEGLLLSLMNSFDTMMVGKLGPAAIVSVGLCSQPRMILLLMAQALCVGTTAVVARRRGEERQDAAKNCLKQSLVIITFIGIAILLTGYFGAEGFVRLAGASSETVTDAATYFRIISLAFVFNCWTLCICAAKRGVGQTKVTMVVNMTANAVNIFLNYCLIQGHLGFPALGVRGAAIATAIGTFVSFIMAALAVTVNKDDYISLRPFGKISFDSETVTALLHIGGGSIAESVFLRVGFLINGRLIAGVGTAAYATNQIVMQVSGLTFTVSDGTASACTALVGQSLGANKKNKAKLYVYAVSMIALVLSLMIMTFTFFGRNLLPTLFTEDKEIIRAASMCFVILLFGVFAQNMRVVLSGCLRGAGDVKYVAIVSLVSVLIIRPLMTYLFCYPLNSLYPLLMLGFLGPWLSFDIDAIVRAVMLYARVKRGQWVNIRI